MTVHILTLEDIDVDREIESKDISRHWNDHGDVSVAIVEHSTYHDPQDHITTDDRYQEASTLLGMAFQSSKQHREDGGGPAGLESKDHDQKADARCAHCIHGCNSKADAHAEIYNRVSRCQGLMAAIIKSPDYEPMRGVNALRRSQGIRCRPFASASL